MVSYNAMKINERGRLSFELIFGIFILSLVSVTISFIATIYITEKKRVEIETLNLQKIFFDIKKNPIDIVSSSLPLPSGVSYGLYNPVTKELIKGFDILPKGITISNELKIIVSNEFFYPTITEIDTVILNKNPYILVLRKDFDAEKNHLKNVAIMFIPFAVVCVGTVTLFSFVIYRKKLLKPLFLLEKAYVDVSNLSANVSLQPVKIKEWDNLFQHFNNMMIRLKEYENSLNKKIEELQSVNKALKSAQDEIIFSEKMATVGRLAAGLAHEIGNPITSIVGYLSFLKADVSNEQQKKIFGIMLEEAERVDRIIKDLLNFARASTSKKTEVTSNPVEVIEDTIRLLEPQKDFKMINLCPNLNISEPIYFSREELRQVVLNVLLNAIDVTKENGTIKITTGVEEDFFTIAIEDEGGGIPEEIKDKIFEPFFTTKPIGKGTGLGLSVVHTLLERSGGKISFENTEKGSIFCIKLKKA